MVYTTNKNKVSFQIYCCRSEKGKERAVNGLHLHCSSHSLPSTLMNVRATILWFVFLKSQMLFLI